MFRIMLIFLLFRILSETCHKLEQLLYLSASQHQLPSNSAFGLEPCCHLFAWDTQSRRPRAPPYAFDPISREDAVGSQFLDLLLSLLFKTPRESNKLLPPFWITSQLTALEEDEHRRAVTHCAEFFRLRGRLFALAEPGCMEHYGGQEHGGVFEVH